MEFEKKDLTKNLLHADRKEQPVAHEVNGTCLSRCRNLENKTVLLIVCCLFAAFATSEMVGALYADSLSLLGDATASCVDVITYCSNYYAEHIATPKKSAAPEIEDGIEQPAHYKKHHELDPQTKLIHEVYVPTFSLLTLIAATLFVFSLAVNEISKGGDDDTDAGIMFAFASVNSVIDAVCITMFYSRKDDVLHHRFPSVTGDDSDSSPASGAVAGRSTQPNQPMLRNANINMFSAFTHVGCDTLRTIAIFVAAIISSSTGIKSSLCDAWAAIVVSITICIAIIPLSLEVYAAFTGKR